MGFHQNMRSSVSRSFRTVTEYQTTSYFVLYKYSFALANQSVEAHSVPSGGADPDGQFRRFHMVLTMRKTLVYPPNRTTSMPEGDGRVRGVRSCHPRLSRSGASTRDETLLGWYCSCRRCCQVRKDNEQIRTSRSFWSPWCSSSKTTSQNITKMTRIY